MKTIAILFELDRNWIGGSYYIRNLVSALAMLPTEEQPVIILVSDKPESVRFIQETGYPDIGWIHSDHYAARPDAFPFDAVFPHPAHGQDARTISWIPDFQELHLRQFFTSIEIENRRNHHRRRFATAGLVVSSQDVYNDVQRFYPNECDRVAVVHFATFDRFDAGRLPNLRQVYGLDDHYVFCANQLWAHKNHIVLLRAVELLHRRGIRVTVVFTGNESDYRVAGYVDLLKQLAVDWGIADQIRFLGFIPREDQLCLMNGADYIVQPSLFEGWSTVIEDAKAMCQFVVASDLAVHKEQLSERCRFFSRHDPRALADVMQELWNTPELPAPTQDYQDARRRFGRDFMRAVDDFLPEGDLSSGERALSRSDLAVWSAHNLRQINVIPGTDAVEDDFSGVVLPVGLSYYAEGSYAQVKVSVLAPEGQVDFLMQENEDRYSLQFHPDSYELGGKFEERYVEMGGERKYMIFFRNECNDASGRIAGLPKPLQVVLRAVTVQDVLALEPGLKENVWHGRRILRFCQTELRTIL